MGDGGAALRAEDAVDGLAGRAFAGVGLGWALDGEFVFGDDGYQGCLNSGSADIRSCPWLVSRDWSTYSRQTRFGAGSHRSGRSP